MLIGIGSFVSHGNCLGAYSVQFTASSKRVSTPGCLDLFFVFLQFFLYEVSNHLFSSPVHLTFTYRYYVWELGRYFALSACFILGFIVWGEAVNWTGTTSFDQQDHYMEVVGGSLARILCWALTLYNLLVEEGREFKAAKSARK